MMHPNVELLRAHLDAMAQGDIPKAMSFYSDDVVFHYPGRNPLSGNHRGKDQVLALMGRVMQLTDGSFRPDVHDILASDDHVAALITVHATRDGTPASWQSVDLYHVRDGKISEHWVHEVDQELVDRFWSAPSK
ncbi:MAG: nuclear transport factor 2 family protein [Chloroflexota bacterium]